MFFFKKNCASTKFIHVAVHSSSIRSPVDIFSENQRSVVMIDGLFGPVAMICFGSMFIGSVNITCNVGDSVSRLHELGFFAFGGSTIVLVFQDSVISFSEDLIESKCHIFAISVLSKSSAHFTNYRL
jgi:phosphatidylserine decarboxylase